MTESATQLEIDWDRATAYRPFTIDRHASIQERFEAFHEANPQVYEALVKMARKLVAMGRKKIGIAMLFEVLRWNHAIRTVGDVDFKLNDNFTSRYARLIASQEPDLAGVFELRQLKA